MNQFFSLKWLAQRKENSPSCLCVSRRIWPEWQRGPCTNYDAWEYSHPRRECKSGPWIDSWVVWATYHNANIIVTNCVSFLLSCRWKKKERKKAHATIELERFCRTHEHCWSKFITGLLFACSRLCVVINQGIDSSLDISHRGHWHIALRANRLWNWPSTW